jgi:CHASE2 domain-containing sensor protein
MTANEITLAEITLAMFTLCNSVRVLAYVPQIVKTAFDRSGAAGISCTTWAMFLLSNASAVAYALVNKGDLTMAIVFLCNTGGCGIVLLIASWKRLRYRSHLLAQGI